MIRDDEDRIRDRAYALWEAAGQPEGDDQHFWHEAERQLAEEGDIDTSKEATKPRKPRLQAGSPAI